MSPWMDHGGVSRTVVDALEMKWTGSGMVKNRRLRSLKMRQWTLCAETMMREARGVDVIDESGAMMDL